MNYKALAQDAYEVAINVTNERVETHHMARAQYHATMAQLEALDTLVALLSPVNAGNTVSIEQLRAEAGL